MEDFNLDIPKIGYIVLTKISPRDIMFGKLIRADQKKFGFSEEDCQFTHSMMSMGGDVVIDAVFPVIKKSRLTRNYAGRYIKIVKPTVLGYDMHRKNVAVNCAIRRGIPYGFLGLFWFKVKKFFKINIFSALGDFCSELCGLGIHQEYVEKLGFEIEQVMPKRFSKMYPADFLDPRYFEIIWEGYIPSKNS